MPNVATATPTKTVAVFLDGTGNSTLGNPTNILKLFRLLKGEVTGWGTLPDGVTVAYLESVLTNSQNQLLQKATYVSGVGTTGSDLNKLLGLAFADGITDRVVQAYLYISRNHQPGDKLIINGFSRGAAEARALAGFIAHCGLMNTTSNDVDDAKNALAAWTAYRNARPGQDEQPRLDELNTQQQNMTPAQQAATFRDVVMDAVCVFDTVCSVGIPSLFPGDNQTLFPINFVDNNLSDKVTLGYHAVAGSEDRVLYAPTYWAQRDGVKQVAFYGVHSNIGGGGPDKYLGNISLNWMQSKLEALGVAFTQPSNCTPQSADVTTPADWFAPTITDPVDIARSARTFPHGTGIHTSYWDRVEGYPGFDGWKVVAQDTYGNSLKCLLNSGDLVVQGPNYAWLSTVPVEAYSNG